MGNLASAGRVRFEELRSLGAGSISTFYYSAVSSSFGHPVRILKVTNLTDADLLISFDGVADYDIVAAKGYCLYDYCTNKTDQSGLLEQPEGDRVYVKAVSTIPTLGSVYVTILYASQV